MNSFLLLAGRSLLAWVLAAQLAIGSSWHHHGVGCESQGCHAGECGVAGAESSCGSQVNNGQTRSAESRHGRCSTACASERCERLDVNPFAKRARERQSALRITAARACDSQGVGLGTGRDCHATDQLSASSVAGHAHSKAGLKSASKVASSQGGTGDVSDCSICRILGQPTAAATTVDFEFSTAFSDLVVKLTTDSPVSRPQRRSHSRAPPVIG
ncbi:MAG: hypothetical protein U1A77_15130 [Pirellulales bacterium]